MSTPPASLDDARARWADARDLSDPVLTDLLGEAWAVCEDFLPVEQVTAYDESPGTFPGGVLLRWRSANVLHARDVWRAGQRDGDAVAFDAYAMRVRPLSDTVKSLLRPRRGRPQVG